MKSVKNGQQSSKKLFVDTLDLSRRKITLPDPDERAKIIQEKKLIKNRIEDTEKQCLKTIQNVPNFDTNENKTSFSKDLLGSPSTSDEIVSGREKFSQTPPLKCYFNRGLVLKLFTEESLNPSVYLKNLHYGGMSREEFNDLIIMNAVRTEGLSDDCLEALGGYLGFLISITQNELLARTAHSLLLRSRLRLTFPQVSYVLDNWGRPRDSCSVKDPATLSTPPFRLYNLRLFLDILSRSLTDISKDDLLSLLVDLLQITLDPYVNFSVLPFVKVVTAILDLILDSQQLTIKELVKLIALEDHHFHNGIFLCTSVLSKCGKHGKSLMVNAGYSLLCHHLGVKPTEDNNAVELLCGNITTLRTFNIYKVYQLLILVDFIIVALPPLQKCDAERLSVALRELQTSFRTGTASCYYTEVFNTLSYTLSNHTCKSPAVIDDESLIEPNFI